jgi:multidrug efflux system membrane fusion protein
MKTSGSFVFAAFCAFGMALFYPFSSAKDPQKSPEPVTVEARVFQAQSYAPVTKLRGSAVAWRKSTLCARSPGTVAEILSDRGTNVKKASPIVVLSADDRKEKEEEANTQVEATKLEETAAKELRKSDFQSLATAAQKEAALKAAIAKKKNASLNLAFARIEAPFDCHVYERFVEIGDTVSIGTKVVAVADLSTVRIVTFCSEKELPLVRSAVSMSTHVGGGEFPAKLVSISLVAEERTRMYRVDFQAENEAGTLADGMTAEVYVKGAEQKAHFLPSSALSLSDEGEVGVKFLDAGGKVRFLEVRILSLEAEGTWVSGLEGSVKVITCGQDFVSVGDAPSVQLGG